MPATCSGENFAPSVVMARHRTKPERFDRGGNAHPTPSGSGTSRKLPCLSSRTRLAGCGDPAGWPRRCAPANDSRVTIGNPAPRVDDLARSPRRFAPRDDNARCSLASPSKRSGLVRCLAMTKVGVHCRRSQGTTRLSLIRANPVSFPSAPSAALGLKLLLNSLFPSRTLIAAGFRQIPQ